MSLIVYLSYMHLLFYQYKVIRGKNIPLFHFIEWSAGNLVFYENESVDLVVAGQAAYWFDNTKLWPEMKR